MTDDVVVYTSSLLSCSVCAPKDMPIEEVVKAAERSHPCGSAKGWTKSADATFAGGEPNPCPCNVFNEERQHWLLDA